MKYKYKFFCAKCLLSTNCSISKGGIVLNLPACTMWIIILMLARNRGQIEAPSSK